jgi:hypothetical protein
MNKAKQNILKTENTTSKSFNYSKGKVSLSFQLRNDIKQDLKDFLELLQRSAEDVESEIKSIK